MRVGRRLAIDYGAARIGLALSTPDCLICSPLTTVMAGEQAISAVAEIAAEHEVFEIYIGLPLNLSGEFTKSTSNALDFAKALKDVVAVEIRLVDERLTTRAAQSQLYASGRNSKTSRRVVDAAAATLILEGAIAFERSTGQTPGKGLGAFDE